MGSLYQWPNGQEVKVQGWWTGNVFQEGEDTNQLFNFSEGSNEEIMGKKHKEEFLSWNVGKCR